MTVTRVIVTGCGLWLGTQIVSGIRLADGLDPLARVGTLLVVALLLAVVDALTVGVRRSLALAVEPLPIAIAAAVALNAVLFWAAAALAHAAGLGYSVTGFLPALLGSLVLLLVGQLSRPMSAMHR